MCVWKVYSKSSTEGVWSFNALVYFQIMQLSTILSVAVVDLAHTLCLTGVKLIMEYLWSAERFVLFELFFIWYSKIFWWHSCRIFLLITYFTWMKSFQVVILLQTLILIHSKGNLSLRGVIWNSSNWPIGYHNSNLWHNCKRQNNIETCHYQYGNSYL